jgi:hypothetical protein
MKRKSQLDDFEIGDRVELVLPYSFRGASRQQGTVLRKGSRFVHCKMERSGDVVGFEPANLRIVKSRGRTKKPSNAGG